VTIATEAPDQERGSGEPLVLLHGGLSDSRFFERNVAPLAERFRVLMPDQRGHGRTPDVSGPFTFEAMADDTIAFMGRVVGEPAHLAGHSNGAFIALLIALRRPELVRRLVLVSGGFHRDGVVSGAGEFDVDAAVEALGDSYGEVSPDGKEHFRVVVEKTAELESKEPALAASELRQVKARTLVMFGDDDLVTIDHMAALYEGIADSELAIVPGTSHFLLQEKPSFVSDSHLARWLGERPKLIAVARSSPRTEPSRSQAAASSGRPWLATTRS
jgi:pimeloyl-ACP methyl ester carboxylesterase